MKTWPLFLTIFGALTVGSFGIPQPAVLAQDAEFVVPLSADLSPTQNRALNQVKDLRTTEGEIQIVKVNPAPLRDRRSVSIPLPGRSAVSLTDVSTHISDSRDFSTVGRISNLPAGTTTVAVNGDAVTGSIQTDKGLYRIRPLGDGAHAIFKAGLFPREHPQSIERQRDELLTRDLPPFERVPEADTSETEIRVLVAYTPAVAQAVFDVKGLVTLAVEESNASYKNSGVHIKLKATESSPLKVSYQESSSHDEDLEALKNTSDGKMDEVHRIRDNEKADIVVLLINNGQFCGLASQIFANKDTAFAVVYHDCATGYYSFAHEIGHIQGARHNHEVDPNIIPFIFGHGFMDRARKRRTVMSYDCPDGCDRLPQWARPPEWGSRELANDALVLNITRRYMASFR